MHRFFDWTFGEGPIPCEALALLGSGWDRAVVAKRSLWAYAADRASLLAARLTDEDLRCLWEQEMVLHHRAGAGPRWPKQPAALSRGPRFGPRSRFVLTVRGIRWAAGLLQRAGTGSWADAIRHAPPPDGPLTPRWNDGSRELSFAGLLVKEFRTRAANQLPLVNAFNAAHWKNAIEIPRVLARAADPPQAVGDALRRFHQAQVNAIVRLRCDGSAGRVVWGECIPV